MKRKILIAVLAVLVAVFAVAVFFVIRDTVRSKREDAANRDIADEVGSLRDQALKDAETDDGGSAPGDKSDPNAVGRPAPGDKKDRFSLYGESGMYRWLEPFYKKNKDLAGWLIIDGTYVDYPVMYTPYREEKYLRMAFDGSYALSGTLFIGGEWDPDACYTVIYGHHMKDGTMFSDLVDYESLDYARTHSKIHFETLTEMYDYDVVFAINTQVGASKNETTFKYYEYEYEDMSDPEVFGEYVALARKAALYDTGVDLKVGDRILVLSTCNYHRDDERFIVIARYRPED